MTGWQPDRVITDARTMRALAHPVRVALLDALAAEDELTATEAAEMLGDSPGNMSWHLQTLAKYGFVEEAATGRGRRRPWRLIPQRRQVQSATDDLAEAAAAEAVETTHIELIMSRMRDWWAVRRSYPKEWREAAFTSNTVTYLTAAELGQVWKDLDDVLARFRERRTDPALRPQGSLPVRVAFFGHPLPPRRAPESDQ